MLNRKKPLKRTPWNKSKDDTVKMPKRDRTPNYKAKLDEVFSKYIRLKYSDSRGYCRCISCGKVLPWKEIQNGHYMSRRYMSTRFAEDNCRPQCCACNIFNQGNIQMYRRALVKEIGENRVNLVEAKARMVTKKYSIFEYKTLIDYYTSEVKKLAEEKGITLK